MRSRSLVMIAVVLAFVAFLTWSTLEAQKVSCNVCVEYNGKQNCAIASHSSVEEAARSAQNTACGTIAHGMDQSIACQNQPPVKQECQAATR